MNIFRRIGHFLVSAAILTAPALAFNPASVLKDIGGMAHATKHRTVDHHAIPPDGSVTHGTPNTACPQFQALGYPASSDAKLLHRAFYGCHGGFANMYDPALKAPLWVAEHVTRDSIIGTAKRNGMDFTEDPLIPYPAQAHRADYRRTGYDLGHLAPAADFRSSAVLMEQSFTMSNVVPQEPSHNRGIWANLEGAVREMASRRGEIYVVSGPVFHGNNPQLKGGATIPDALFKVLLDPRTKEATAFIIPNKEGMGDDPARYQVRVREVEKATGLDFHPSLSRPDADRMEAANGGNWLVPKVRVKFRD